MSKPNARNKRRESPATSNIAPEDNRPTDIGEHNPMTENDVRQLAAQAGLEGSSYLTTLPISLAVDDPATTISRATPDEEEVKPSLPSDTAAKSYNMGELASTLQQFAEGTHLEYDSLDNELQLAREWQEQLVKQQDEVKHRIDIIQQRAQSTRLVFSRNLELAKEALAVTPSDAPRQVERPSYNVSPEAPVGGRYQSPMATVELSSNGRTPIDRYRLFRAREPGEADREYQTRVNEQNYLLARDVYEDARRERHAKAEETWRHISGETRTTPPISESASRASAPEPDQGYHRPLRRTEAAAGTPALPSRRTEAPLALATHGPSPVEHLDEPNYLSLTGGDALLDIYTDRQVDAIRATIRDRMDRIYTDTPALKNIKNVPLPDKYGGEDDAEAFLSWLKSFLRWLSLSRLVGSGLDADRVYLLGQHLTKEARLWYDNAVDSMTGIGRRWSFEQAICEMYKHFIHKSTARSAAERFHQTKYRRETGVNGLWDTLVSLARKMPALPDNYSFKQRFIDALPEEICAPLLRNQHVSTERSSPQELRLAALQQEENNRAVDDWRANRRAPASRDADRSSRPLIPAVNKGVTNRGPSLPTQTNGRSVLAPYKNPMAIRPTSHRLGAPAPVIAGNTGDSTRATTGSSPRPVQCYNCREMGHISSQCPKAQQPRLRATRVLDDTLPIDKNITSSLDAECNPDEGTGNISPAPAGGDTDDLAPIITYVSDKEYYDVDGTQYDPDEHYYAPGEGDGEDLWFGSMRHTDGPDTVETLSDEAPSREGVRPPTPPNDWSLVTNDFSGNYLGIPMGTLITPEVAATIQRDLALTADPSSEDYSDMPGLMTVAETHDYFYNHTYHDPRAALERRITNDLDSAWARIVTYYASYKTLAIMPTHPARPWHGLGTN
ncbi:hypothetical protein C2E23DRAFT_861396 [Lenzites betulinus]|nr:hypothetical protein C2E23DRAFT_861396 [Lenzites betulinus]